MNTTIEQQTNNQDERVQAALRATAVREVCQDIDIKNEFVLPPSPETRKQVESYVDLRAIDPRAAAEQYPGIETAIQDAKQYREHLRTIGLGRSGLIADEVNHEI